MRLTNRQAGARPTIIPSAPRGLARTAIRKMLPLLGRFPDELTGRGRYRTWGII